MKHLVLSVALTVALASTVVAGDIPSGGIAPPPPPPPRDGIQATTTTGEVPSVGVMGDIPSGGLSYQIADTTVDLIQMLLGFAV